MLSKRGPILALNTVLDEHRNLVFCSFGEIIASHLAAVEHVRASVEIHVPRRFKTILASAGGYPLDKTYVLSLVLYYKYDIFRIQNG
jgi:nickel-dependent lactate racemase